MTLNEGHGQYNEHVMHSHVCGSRHAKFDGDDFNSFRGIACEGQTDTHRDRHTHTDKHTHTHTGSSIVNKVALGLSKQQKEESTDSSSRTFHHQSQTDRQIDA